MVEGDRDALARREIDLAERRMAGDPRERKQVAYSLAIALAFHVVALWAVLPDWGPDPVRVDPPSELAMKVQFLQPPPPPAPPKPEPPKPETRKIPRPDPTPDEPEPVAEPAPPAPAEQEPAPVADMGPIRVAAGHGPGLIKRVEPRYPPPARAARLEGTVVLDAVILKDGTVSEVTVLRSAHPMFDRAATEALKQWRFTPGDHDVVMSLTVHFVLSAG